MSVNRFACVFLLLLLATGLGLSYKGYSVTCQDQGNLVLTFNLADYAVEPYQADGQTFSKIAFNGNVWTREKGFAELPVLSASVQLPAQGNFKVQVLDDQFEYVQLHYPLLPSKGVIYRNQNPGEIPYWIDPQTWSLPIYPQKAQKVSEPYIYRDIRGLTVFVCPMQYMPREGLLKVHRTLRLALVPDTAQESINPVIVQRQGVTKEMDSVYSALFINYNPQADYVAGNGQLFNHELGENGEMLVIYTSRDATAIQPYITWKREKGFKVSTLQVATGTNVKTNIQSAYTANPNLLYVQLVGDWADIKSDLGTSSSAPTDPMLGCVAGSDNFPDLIIGRFPAASATEVTTMINKAIKYEKSPSGTWYTKGLGIGSSEGAGAGDDGEIDYDHIDVIKENKLLPYTYTAVTEAYGSPTASSIATAVNAGLSVINYCGHGSDTYWVTSGFSTSNVASLTNGDMLPVIYSVACVNGTFHKTTECFAESWLRKSGGGAVAVLMATINLPWTPPMRGQDYMNDLLTGGYDYAAGPGDGTSTTYGKTTFGSTVFNGMVLAYAESAGSDDLDTLKTWTIFGDASVQVRTANPTTIAVSNTTVQSGVAFTTKVTAGGAAVAGARVTLSQGTAMVTGTTDANGNVTLSHAFTSGSVTLVVTGLNLTTIYQTVTVGGGGTNNPPTANFTFSASNLAVNFTDSSTDSDGTIASRAWNFGDGGTSTAANPSHTYASAGTYSVQLTVTDDDGATNAVTKSVTVSSAANNPPTANFTFSASQLAVTFTDSSTDSDGTIASRAWNFGDGSTSTTANPSHTYASAGTYSVQLTVTDDDGATNAVTKSVTVSTGITEITNGQTISSLSAAKSTWLKYRINVPSGASNLVISISGGTGDADLYTKYNAEPTTSAYDCRPYKSGNTESCTVATPSAGYYYIGLYAYAAYSGVSLTASYSTTVNQPPTASFTKTVSNLVVTCTDTSTDSDGTIASRSWNFGDGGTATTANPSHTYAAAGTYTISLTVTDNKGATGSTSSSVTVSTTGGPTPISDGQTLTGLSGSQGAWKYYYVDVPSGATNLVIATTGGTGDLDLYTKYNAQPTSSSYDCRPYQSGNAESCTVAAPTAGRYYIGLYAYSAFASASLSVNYDTGGSNPGGGFTESNISASTGAWKYYTVTVPTGMTTLSIKTSGGTGDADLYVRKGSQPTTSAYDYRPYLSGNTESVSVSNPAAAVWHIGIRAYSTFSGVTLTVSYAP